MTFAAVVVLLLLVALVALVVLVVLVDLVVLAVLVVPRALWSRRFVFKAYVNHNEMLNNS